MPGTLPVQHANSLSAPWSIAADNQLREILEVGLAAALGTGVLAGGRVTRTGALSVEVEAGTILFCEGVALELDAAAAKTGLTAGSTNYLWGEVTRTARDRTTPTAVDAWALTLTGNTTGTPPSAPAIPLATISIPVTSITMIDDAPAGKYLQRVGQIQETIPMGSVVAVDIGYQVNARGRVTVRGKLSVRGRYYVRGRD